MEGHAIHNKKTMECYLRESRDLTEAVAIKELRCARTNNFVMPEPLLQDEIPDEHWQYTGKVKNGQSKYVILTTPESFYTLVDNPISLSYSVEKWSPYTRKMEMQSRFVPALCLAWIVADEFQYTRGLKSGVWGIIYSRHLLHNETPPLLHGSLRDADRTLTQRPRGAIESLKGLYTRGLR